MLKKLIDTELQHRLRMKGLYWKRKKKGCCPRCNQKIKVKKWLKKYVVDVKKK